MGELCVDEWKWRENLALTRFLERSGQRTYHAGRKERGFGNQGSNVHIHLELPPR